MFRSIQTILLMVASLLVVPAHAADEHNIAAGLTAAGAPLGLHGVDPVALLEDGDAIAGTAVHTAVHDGVAYYFASADNLAKFDREPARYAPQFGGFCTFGVSVAKKFDGDPRYAAVEQGKLYVFLNAEVFEAFRKDRAGTIRKAAANWQAIESKPATAL